MGKTVNLICIGLLVTMTVLHTPNIFDFTICVEGGKPPPPDDGINGIQYIDGDWEVTGNEEYTNETIILTGNLTIKNGGTLTFNNVTLKMNSSDEGDNEFRINVESGGQFFVYDYDNDNTTTQDASVITNNTNYYYLFDIFDGAKVVMKNSELSGCRYKTFSSQSSGIHVYSDDVIFDRNVIKNNYLALLLVGSSATISNNTVINNDRGLYVSGGSAVIFGNKIMNNQGTGIFFHFSPSSLFDSNVLISNGWAAGVAAFHSSPMIINTTILSSTYWGIEVGGTSSPIVINSTISGSGFGDVWLDDGAQLTLLNTQFDKSSVTFDNGAPLTTSLIVQWYLHANVTNSTGDPVQGAQVKVYNVTDSLVADGQTGPDGFSRWMIVTERVQYPDRNDSFTPHNITVIKQPKMGYARPEPWVDHTQQVNITLDIEGSFLNLEEGWNLISLPLIQSNTSLNKVLESIDGKYDAVQYYNATDVGDHWKHNQTSKPSHLNDLSGINHTIGFWVHIIEPGGVLFACSGTQPTQNQSIALHEGWNLIGYPSLSNKKRTTALNNIIFGSDVDSIWAYDATTQTWKEMAETDYFEVGKGYWLHSLVDITWEVPL